MPFIGINDIKGLVKNVIAFVCEGSCKYLALVLSDIGKGYFRSLTQEPLDSSPAIFPFNRPAAFEFSDIFAPQFLLLSGNFAVSPIVGQA